ncbi:UDP-3-O-[3-hydroxymyristoyl] N-acetylglucosamine deacetylase [Candidatus Dependentiae bacterium]|nr:UDP-3-O-[3-hydroxymyristoyl] N-acetylglucosamine deacetylase [Candidatus Dependentiae bacterium]
MLFQKTIQAPVSIQGIGVHAGTVSTITLSPAAKDTGIIFINAHNPAQRIRIGDIIPEPAMHATVIKANGWSVSTVEHLMAVLWVFGITNLEIIVAGTEVPILDGSALLFCHQIRKVGIVTQEAVAKVIIPRHEVVLVDEKGRKLLLAPAEKGLSIAYTADFKSPLAGNGILDVTLTEQVFEREIAPARTFGFLDQLPLLRNYNLARGTSLGNTLVVGDDLVNPMRLSDECVRHKILDLIGDMALLGVALQAHIAATKTGHDFNRLLVKHYKEHPEDWKVVD